MACKRSFGLRTFPLSIGFSIGCLAVASCERKTESSTSCYYNLGKIEGAKNHWALDRKKQNGDLVSVKDLEPYMDKWPKCPDGGVYAIGRIGEAPKCSIGDPALPRPVN